VVVRIILLDEVVYCGKLHTSIRRIAKKGFHAKVSKWHKIMSLSMYSFIHVLKAKVSELEKFRIFEIKGVFKKKIA